MKREMTERVLVDENARQLAAKAARVSSTVFKSFFASNSPAAGCFASLPSGTAA